MIKKLRTFTVIQHRSNFSAIEDSKMKEELHSSILFSSFIELTLPTKVNGLIINHMDMEKITILMEDIIKEPSLRVCHMDSEDSSMLMGTIMKVRSSMEEETVKECIIHQE